jgi:autotransporter-associated beta strand protein
LVKSGTGALVATVANYFSGAVTVNAGSLNIRNAAALGSAAGATTVASGAALELQGGITVSSEGLTLSGDGVGSLGALRNISENNTFGGSIALLAASRINSDSGLLTLGVVVSSNQDLRFCLML